MTFLFSFGHSSVEVWKLRLAVISVISCRMCGCVLYDHFYATGPYYVSIADCWGPNYIDHFNYLPMYWLLQANPWLDYIDGDVWSGALKNMDKTN